MDYYSSHISKLIEEFSKLPGIGAKSAGRLAFHVLSMSDEQVDALTNAISSAKRNVRYCTIFFCPMISQREMYRERIIFALNSYKSISFYIRIHFASIPNREFLHKLHLLYSSVFFAVIVSIIFL